MKAPAIAKPPPRSAKAKGKEKMPAPKALLEVLRDERFHESKV